MLQESANGEEAKMFIDLAQRAEWEFNILFVWKIEISSNVSNHDWN